MGKIPRLKDIARESGYSIKTVSRALNNHPDINLKTKQKILRIAKKYSYHPNLLARSLRTRKTYTIGYIIPDINNEFFARVGIVIEDEFRKHGYNILISFTKGQSNWEIESLKLLLSKRVDGVVLATVGETEEYIKKMIHDYKIPIVVIDNKIDVPGLYFVLHDNVRGAYILTKHLIEHGHRDIACITGPLKETSGSERLEGFSRAMDEYGVKINKDFIRVSNWEEEGGFNVTLDLFKSRKSAPTAIFSANSVMAIGIYKALRKLGIKIPDDVAIVSFDDFDFVEILDPPLTTLGNVEKDIGRKAVEILLDEINGTLEKNMTKEYRFGSEVILRKSCGCE